LLSTAADPSRLRALDTRLPTHIGAATTAKDVAS
jgi:hypothetical protein